MMLTLHYGEHIIQLERLTSKAKTPKLSICVKPNAQVVVRAPIHLKDKDILPFLYQKAGWIHEKQQYFLTRQQTTTPSILSSGSRVFYLGEHYQLKLIEAQKKQILLSEQTLEIHTPNQQTDYVNNLLEDWYRTQAQIIFTQRLIAQ